MFKRVRGLMALLAMMALMLGFAPPASAADHTYQVLSNNSFQTIGSDCHKTALYGGVYGASYVRTAAKPAYRSMFQVIQYVYFCVYIGIDNSVLSSTTSTDDPQIKLRWFCGASDDSEEQCVSFRTTLTMYVNSSRIFSVGIGCNEDPSSSLAACNTVSQGHNDTGWMRMGQYPPFTVYHPSNNQLLMSLFHGYTSAENFNGYNVGSAATDTYSVTDNF